MGKWLHPTLLQRCDYIPIPYSELILVCKSGLHFDAKFLNVLNRCQRSIITFKHICCVASGCAASQSEALQKIYSHDMDCNMGHIFAIACILLIFFYLKQGLTTTPPEVNGYYLSTDRLMLNPVTKRTPGIWQSNTNQMRRCSVNPPREQTCPPSPTARPRRRSIEGRKLLSQVPRDITKHPRPFRIMLS